MRQPSPARPPRRRLGISAAASIVALVGTPGAARAADLAGLQPTTDPISQAIVGLLIAAAFVALVLETAHRVLVVLCAVAVAWAVTYLTPYRILPFERAWAAIDINVILLLAAMMAIVAVMKSTGVFAWAVSRLAARSAGRPTVAIALVAWTTAVLSAFADNVTTVIFMTPMAVTMARHLQLRPAAILLPMVMAANIGGTATLIGDPPNIMIGSAAELPFMAFLANLAVPVLIMMFGLDWLSRRLYRDDIAHARAAAHPTPTTDPVTVDDPRLLRWMLVITAGVFAGFLTHGATGMPAAVPAVIGGAAALLVQDVLYLRRHRPTHAERVHGILHVIEREIEWPTLAFFAFLFMLVGAAVATGLVGSVARGLTWAIAAGADSFGLSPVAALLFAALLILWTAGVLSALIDNIPFVAVAIPIVAQLTATLPGDTTVLWWALSLGACLGGNGTPVGASANVTVVGLAEREGARISFPEFSRVGLRVAAWTLLVASAFLAAHVYLGASGAFRAGLAVLALIVLARLAVGARRAVPRPADAAAASAQIGPPPAA